MLILPAIDLLGGKCVRLVQGDYGRSKTYDGDPADTARRFSDEGAEIIHVVDLDGAKAGLPVNLDVIRRIVAATDALVEVGGGVRTMSDAQALLALGVGRVILGSSLIGRQAEAAEMLSELGERAVAGIDARDGKVAVAGWTEHTGADAVELARWVEKTGGRRLIVTDIATDGMLAGPNMELLGRVCSAVSIPVIASGGVASLEDLIKLDRMVPPLEGSIVGKAIYEGRFTVAEAVGALKGHVI